MGFEPTEGVNPHSLSRRARSAASVPHQRPSIRARFGLNRPDILLDGDVRERPNRRAWRARDPARGPRVQISSSPPLSLRVGRPSTRDSRAVWVLSGAERNGEPDFASHSRDDSQKKWPCTSSWTRETAGAIPGSRLRPGGPAAHSVHRLRLLPSGPDRVHGSESRRTRPSTLLAGGDPAVLGPQTSNRPGISRVSGSGDPEPPA